MQIGPHKIGRAEKPFIIAELSANHGGSIESAKEAILAAKNSFASAIKIQSYTPETMTIDSKKPDFLINDGLWKGYNLYELYKEAYTPFEWHEELFDYANSIGITIFSSPFDETAVDLLESLDAPAYKIASFELIDLPLIKRAAKSNKPLLMSTGMASLDEISDALEVAKTYGNGEVLLFHCISSYPAPIEESNLANIQILKNTFGVEVGLSDHTITNLAANIAIGLGATAIEKHFKPSDQAIGPDASFSINPEQLKLLVSSCNEAWKSFGTGEFIRPLAEEGNRKFRRSIYFVNDLKKGEKITKNDVKCIRPGYGVPPKYIDEIIGAELTNNVERGDPVRFDDYKA